MSLVRNFKRQVFCVLFERVLRGVGQLVKFFFYRPSDDSKIAETGNHLIALIRDAIVNLGHSECGDSEGADAIIFHEKFRGYYPRSYQQELLRDPVLGSNLSKALVISFGDHAHGLLRGVYVGLRSTVSNSKMHRSIPYMPKQFPNPLTRNPDGLHWDDSKIKYLATFMGSQKTSKLREQIFSLFSESKDFYLSETGDYATHPLQQHEAYVAKILQSRFVLCPGGWSPSSFRIFECMALGRVPVIISDKFVTCDGIPWNDFALVCKEENLGSLRELLHENLCSWSKLAKNAREYFLAFASETTIFDYYAKQLIQLSEINSDLNNDHLIRSWWKSKTLVRGNGWALHQRLLNKARKIIGK